MNKSVGTLFSPQEKIYYHYNTPNIKIYSTEKPFRVHNTFLNVIKGEGVEYGQYTYPLYRMNENVLEEYSDLISKMECYYIE